MRMTHNYDVYGNTESAIIYLAKPGKRFFCALGGIDTSTVSVTLRTNNTAELTFTVDKYVDGVESQGYEELDEMMELYCDGIWYKIMDPPTETNDGTQCTKDITAESYEISLTQYKLKNFKINMGEEDSYEMMYQKNHDINKFYQIKFYNPENEDLSFLHIVLKHADVPGWKIGYVDNITPDDDKVLLPNEICNFDVNDQNVYAFFTQTAAPAYKCVFEFDTENLLINVYKPDSLGKDTNVVLGFRNIQDSVTISRDDSLVTQFYVDGLDDYNIDLANFGNSVITDCSHFCREPYMNIVLQEKYTAWQKYIESRRDEYCNLSREYNKNLEILAELMNRVPIDTAQTNWFGQKVEDLKDAYDSNMAIIKGIESIHVDEEGNFDLEDLKNSSDWPMYESIMNYTLPSIVAALQAQDETIEGFGKGNIISCVNPVVLGQDWYMVGSGTSSFQTVQINDAPAYGITRGVKVTGTDGGIYQHNISIEPSQRYTLSCFVKGSGTFYLGYNNTGEDRKNISYNITSSWIRVYTSFNLTSHLIDVAFTGSSDFIVCGMQLEMGDAPSQFGYFTQSETIMKAYETDWKLYGIAELKTKIAIYDSCIKELKKNGYADGYNPLSGYEEAYFTQMHQKYLDYLNLKDQAETALKERQAEYDTAKKPEIQEKRNQIAKDVLMENFGKVQEKYPAFTDKETYIIKSLYNQATYSNENIIITTLDSTVDAVDKAITLYKDAVEELYVESHPQYTYTDEIGNIYALPEFREYHDQLAVNDFVRLGLSDTRYVKLRVVEIRYNPCDMDETMEVTFSNMVQYKSKLTNDNEFLTNALNQTSDRTGGRVNSINKSSTSDYVITSEAIKQIFSNPLFNSMLGGTTTGGSGSGGTGSGGTITADTIIAELVKAKEGVFDKLTVDTAFMKYLDVKLISADKITTRILEAEQANIEKLSAKIIESNQINADMINVKNLLAGHAGVGELHTIHLTVENAEIDQAVITNLIAKKIAVGDLMAQNALANQIVLISKDNKPTIAFQESTQQFYDSKGNVRVQIGMDGKGDFNFIVKNGDRAALFDENGITQTGIPDNTILGDMINNATITKDKLGFQIIEPNEQGGIDITNIYDGKGNQWWGIEKTTITDDYTKQIKNVTDTLTGQIETKVSNTQYLKDQESIRTDFSDIKQNVSGITSTVSSMQTDLSEAQEKIKANTSSITQNADKISFMVTGDKESEFTVTDKFIQMISDHISIDASTIDINGIITAMNTHTGPGKTKIDGGIIETNTITADSIKVDAIRSKIFEDDLTSNYSLKGIWFDLSENGAIKGKNFAVDSNGNAYIRGDSTVEGTIIANKGYIGGIGGFHIEAGKLYSGMDTFPEQPTSISKDKNVYIGTDGIALGGGNFRVDPNGKLYANSGTFSGTIYADGGTIGGWNISANSLSNRDGSISLNPDGLKLGNQLNIDNQGNATFGGKLSAATGSFSGELVAATGSFSGELKAATGTFSGDLKAASGTFSGTLNGANGTFSGVLSAATGSFTGAVTATSLTLSGCKIDYNTDIENKPDIPSDMTLYIKTDGTVGTLTEEVQNIPTGAKGFKVSSDGLLQASNAIIYGTIFANQGTIGGFNITTRLDNSDHAYENTLYVQTTDGSGNTYQSGIRGNTSNNDPSGAAFYVRKKTSSMTSWADAEYPFVVRKNGRMLCTDITIGDSLNMLMQDDYNDESKKVKAISTDSISTKFGYISNSSAAYMSAWKPGSNSPGILSFFVGGGQALNMERQGSGLNRYYTFYPCNVSVDLGLSTDNFRNLYIEKIIFPDKSSMTTAKTSGDASSYGSLTNKPGINGHTLASGNNTLSNLGIAARSHSHSNSDINWSTTLGYKGFGHCHTVLINSDKNMCVAISNGSVPAFTPYNVTSYTNIDNYMVSAGGTCNLGSTSAPWNAVYAKNYYDEYGNKISTGGGSISLKIDGVTRSSGFTNYNLATQDWVAGKGYLTQHQSLSGYATTSWVKGAFGDTLSISGSTLYLKNYNGSQLSSVTLPTSSGGGNYAPLNHTHDHLTGSFDVTVGSSTMYPDGDGSYSCGSSGHRWKYVYASNGINTGSDEYIKENIKSITNFPSIDKFYMSLNPIQYKFKQRPNDDEISKIHFGFGARETERHLKENNFESENYSIVTKSILDKPNFVGRTDEYSMNYLEFISLNTHMTQKAHHRIDSLESENQSLKNEILMLQGQLSLITQRLQKMEEKLC